ncbi:putative late blight resistance protein homolog R1B-12 [Salvia miltiorrhiza]|uniref:putative late blight resistance protein homolog R1B-12 n=1 Tax=Salvia miltiorrhiza TaxID=226208 RepID=UPI0025AC8D8A|nr:putative late blight resistance protein homolog R1B-12 [Salvia miltiorrhiza]
MAYEALDNLQQTLDQILEYHDDLVTHSVKQEILSINVQAAVLQLNLKHYPNKEKIREVANTAYEIIQYFFFGEYLSDCGSTEPTVIVANKLRELAQRLESTVGDVVDYIKGNDPISTVTDSHDVSSSSRSAITSSKDDIVVGFEEDVKVIKDRLCKGSSRLQVLPIVGTGGIASMKEISDAKSDIPMENLIYEYLKCRRYLIVMDDMWSKKAWDDVKMLFPDAGNSSGIIVTTRLQDVAAYSWNLLKRKVFGYNDIPSELEDSGFKIAKNCGGLPLSLVMAAGLLSKIPIHNRDSWKQIAADSGQLETIICLSYTHLPSHSKPCLLYMADFPEDYEIRVSELIHLWICEGFVALLNGSKSLEEEAEDCIEDLVERSLVLVTNTKSIGKIKSCSLLNRTFRLGRREYQ